MSAAIPAELRERAGRAAHEECRARYAGTAAHAPRDCTCAGGHALGADGYCTRCRATGEESCRRCVPALADWPDLTDAQREAFRAQGDPALSVVAPMLVECAQTAEKARQRLATLAREQGAVALFPGGLLADLIARLAALGIT